MKSHFTNCLLLFLAEAREHGVGFYEFSTDHDERAKQQEALSKIRDATLDAQQERADLKKSRDDVIANRVKMAKARVRARLGLPPEEENPAEEPGKFFLGNGLHEFINFVTNNLIKITKTLKLFN